MNNPFSKKPQVLVGLIFAVVIFVRQAAFSQLITWHDDKSGLPYAVYNGKIPFENKNLDQPKDPFFMMGNYKFLVFPHVSGVYQLLCGERAWGRLNDADSVINYGANNAQIKINDQAIQLVGLNSLAASGTTRHTFGVGFARYDYELPNNIYCTRNISVKPSPAVNKGLPGMLITVALTNHSNTSQNISYYESVTARYRMIGEKPNVNISYPCHASKITGTSIVKAMFKYQSPDPLLIKGRDAVSAFDGYPALLFMAPLNGQADGNNSGYKKINGYASELYVNYSFTLKPHEKRILSFVVGYAIGREDSDVLPIVAEFRQDMKSLKGGQSSLYSIAWAAKLPRFLKEPDTAMRRELVWNAYFLDAFAKHSSYYDETFIPQGMVYDFVWGKQAAARDLIQAALPLCHYNPELAKSTLKLMMKKMFPTGLIEYTDYGYGTQNSFVWKPSDQQLFFFLLMSEYLKQTKDFSFLKEKTLYYPKNGNNPATTLDKIIQAFFYLRDVVGTGSHGMVRILNSDWNDVVFSYFPINNYYQTAESHMNASLALNALYGLIANLEAAMQQPRLIREKPAIAKLVASMKRYRKKQLAVFLKDMEKRTFPRRLYLNKDLAVGDTAMYLEPVVYMMGIPDIPLAMKKSVLAEMKARLMNNEPLGAKEMEIPRQVSSQSKGSRENGGFWYALNGPLMVGLSSWDRATSMDLYKKMSFKNYAAHYPGGWVGWWSAPDAVNANISEKPGDVTDFAAAYPVFCSHAHMWTVLGYYYLYE